jgi:hypothetical protein
MNDTLDVFYQQKIIVLKERLQKENITWNVSFLFF